MTAPSSRYSHQRYLLRKTGITAGFLVPYLRAEHIRWLASHKPEGMTVAEFLITGILEDAMAEDPE